MHCLVFLHFRIDMKNYTGLRETYLVVSGTVIGKDNIIFLPKISVLQIISRWIWPSGFFFFTKTDGQIKYLFLYYLILSNFLSLFLYPFLLCSFSSEQLQKNSELRNPPSLLNCEDKAENLDIQGDSGLPQCGLTIASPTVGQLTVEEKTIRQVMKEVTDGDTIQEGDPKQAAEEGSTQEKVLKQIKKRLKVGQMKGKM